MSFSLGIYMHRAETQAGRSTTTVAEASPVISRQLARRDSPLITRFQRTVTAGPGGYGYLGALFAADERNPWQWHLDADTLRALHEDVGHIFSVPLPDGSGTRDYLIAKRIVRGDSLSLIAQAMDDPLDILSIVDHKGAIVGSMTAQSVGETRLISGNRQHALLSVRKIRRRASCAAPRHPCEHTCPST